MVISCPKCGASLDEKLSLYVQNIKDLVYGGSGGSTGCPACHDLVVLSLSDLKRFLNPLVIINKVMEI